MSRQSVAAPLADILEKEWDHTLFNSQKGLAPMLGWRLCYHTLRSKGSQSGFPDRVLARDRVIFAELKREKKTATPITDAQREWLDGLAKAGSEAYLWRPSDLDEIARVLSKRWRYLPRGYRSDGVVTADAPLLVIDGERWTPASIWVDGGRYDEIGREAEIPGQTTTQDFVA